MSREKRTADGGKIIVVDHEADRERKKLETEEEEQRQVEAAKKSARDRKRVLRHG